MLWPSLRPVSSSKPSSLQHLRSPSLSRPSRRPPSSSQPLRLRPSSTWRASVVAALAAAAVDLEALEVAAIATVEIAALEVVAILDLRVLGRRGPRCSRCRGRSPPCRVVVVLAASGITLRPPLSLRPFRLQPSLTWRSSVVAALAATAVEVAAVLAAAGVEFAALEVGPAWPCRSRLLGSSCLPDLVRRLRRDRGGEVGKTGIDGKDDAGSG